MSKYTLNEIGAICFGGGLPTHWHSYETRAHYNQNVCIAIPEDGKPSDAVIANISRLVDKAIKVDGQQYWEIMTNYVDGSDREQASVEVMFSLRGLPLRRDAAIKTLIPAVTPKDVRKDVMASWEELKK